MSSVLKPSLTASVPQNSSVPPQLNKPMHPQQGPPQSYGQPSNHLQMMSHGNPTVAHNHPTTHQPNHFSLNLPNASGHYMPTNQPIPASNHPVPNNPSQPSGQQIYGGAKNMAYQGGYQPNLGHPPNQSGNQLPPVSQTLPATNSQVVQHHTDDHADRSQSNGTTEEKSNCTQENHVTTPKETSNTPALPTQPPSEKTVAAPHEKPSEPQKPVEQDKPVALDASSSNLTPASTSPPASESTTQNTQKLASPSQSVTLAAKKAPEVKENKPSSPVQTETQVESGADTNKEKKNDDIKNSDVKEDVRVPSNEKQDSEEADTVDESESANTPADSEVGETMEPEVKEKPAATPKPRAPPRKTTTKVQKSEEESPKTPRVEHNKPSPSQKSPSTSKSKRARIRTQPYQSPLPELEIISKISASTSSQRNKTNDDKLIVFFKNEFLAVRNSEGSFYICQAVQNIHRSSTKIRIRWLSQDKNDKTNEIYTPDFYDTTDFDCILTNLNLERVEKGKFRLPPAESDRTDSILKRSLAAEKGEEIPSPTVTEEHPDGLDLSLYKDENQLNKRKGKKRKATSPIKSPRNSSRTPTRKSPEKPKVAKATPKSSKKPVRKEMPTPAKSTPVVTPASKKTTNSRMERAKRRSDTASTKVSPVSPKVDHKKAKALAKVARKNVVLTPKPPTPVKKETKPSKPTPPPPSKAKTNVKASTSTSSKKKVVPKRSLRK